MAQRKQPPTTPDTVTLRAVACFHKVTQKWQPVGAPEIIGPIYRFDGPAGQTAFYAAREKNVFFLGADLSAETIQLVRDVHRMRGELAEMNNMFNRMLKLSAETLRISGFTTRQAAAVLGITNGRVSQITGRMDRADA